MELRSSDITLPSDNSARGDRHARVTTIAAVGDALQALQDGRSDEEVRLVMRGLCSSARQELQPAEQLLIEIKTAWGSVPARLALKPESARTDALAKIIRLTIDEYYGVVRDDM